MSAQLLDADSEAWDAHYPNGLGPSAFGSPQWQRLVAAEADARWQLRRLVAPGERDFQLPVMVRRGRSGRYVLETHPVAYPVAPIGRAAFTEEDWRPLLSALASPRIAQLGLWLSAGSPWRPEPDYHGIGRVRVSAEDTYLIRLDGALEKHLAERTSSLRRRKLRSNERRGLTLEVRPEAPLRDAYYALYARVFGDRAWVGECFSRAFFEGVATSLGEGGELCVALRDGEVVGGGVLLYDHHHAYYFQGAVDRDARDVSPHDALYLRALQEASRRGIGTLNLGGVNRGNEGLVRFKRSWGAEPVPFVKLHFSSGVRVFANRLLGRAP